MQSCEIILLHEGADLVGVHGFERVQQARSDALAADADAAQFMPDDAVRGQHAFRADLLVSQAAQSRGNAGRLIKCELPAAAFGLIAAQRIHQPVQCLLVGECAAERLHGFLTAQERRQQVEVVRAQLAVVHAAGV